jgi:sugar lactone lactonase YvrE
MGRLVRLSFGVGAALVLSAGVLPFLGTPVAQAAGPDPQGTIYVADWEMDAIDVFAPNTTGNVPPERVITGASTGLSNPGDVKVDAAGDLYVANWGAPSNGSITEYGPGASGNVAPIKTITGPNTGFDHPDDISLAPDGTLYVANDYVGAIQVFAPGASGNATPVRTITGPATGLGSFVDGVGVDAAGTLFAADTNHNSIAAFAPGANGNVPPEYTISGVNTGLAGPDDVVVGFDGKLYVSNHTDSPFYNSVEVFSPGSENDVAPAQNITPSGTSYLDDLGLDATGNIYVTDYEGAQVPVFAADANGAATPIANIVGAATTFEQPEGVAIAGPSLASSATVTTAVSNAAIGTFTPTSDTATIAGGTSPTGSLVFKLFGPGDPTCSAAPAYTSPLVNVNGDGQYPSPAFTPTQQGTYSWQVLYSGDANNAAVTTACGDPAETVTVGFNPNGYRMVANEGGIFDFGLNFNGSLANTKLNAPIVGLANSPGPNGYLLAGGDGGVFAEGGANFYGSLGGHALPSAIAAIAAPPSETGYWLVATNGKIYPFGSVPALPAVQLPPGAVIVGMASTTDGMGAWMTDQLGDVYAEGDALYEGGLGGTHINAPIVGIAAAAAGQGYVLAAADGGAFNYGTQGFFGSVPGSLKPGQKLVAPIVGIAVTHSGNGYWMVGADGGLFNYGDAPFLGSIYTAVPGGKLNGPIVGIQHLGS